MVSMGSLPNMEIDDENIVEGKRTRSRTARYVHPDEGTVFKSVYRDEEIDMAAEEAGEEFVPINADCVENGEEEESDGESDGELPPIAPEDEQDTPSGSYVPSEMESDINDESCSSDDDGEENE